MLRNILLLLVTIISVQIQGQKFDKLDKSPMDRAYYPEKATLRTFEKSDEKKKASEPKIRVTYSRPAKKGREIFGKLLKFEKSWRIGANESTEIIFMTDVVFGNTPIKAGRNSFIAIPTATEWTLKLNTIVDGWGNYGYDPSKDIASITAPVQSSKKEIEYLSIALNEVSTTIAHLKIGWDTSIAEFPITLN